MLAPMPSQPADASAQRKRRCTATTTSGERCRRACVPGLTVCKSHGGATAASVRKSRTAVVAQSASLWGISADAGSISVVEQLTQLARNKHTDIIALRLKISGDAVERHIGMLTAESNITEYDILGTVQSKQGSQESRTRKASVSVWVQELHKTETEYLAILKLLHEVTGGTVEVDTTRLKMQAARQAARIVKGFPGISIDDVAAEVAKSA